MARRVFFSFHYERDIWRANVVRMSGITKEDREDAGFWDASLWEEAKKKGDEAIKRMIDKGLEGTSVTAVLIGTETAAREYVIYEIMESYKKGNGLLGVYVHNIKDQKGQGDLKGESPFNRIYIEKDGRKVYFSAIYPTYEWVYNKGHDNFGNWVEEAAQKAGR